MTNENRFGETIYSYSRAQAIEDGVLVDLSHVDSIRQHWKHPFACTSAVWGIIEDALQRPIKTHAVGEVRPELILQNAHDGTRAYRIDAGLYRLVCRNGLVVADAHFARIAIRHFDVSAEKFATAAQSVANDTPRVLEIVARWQTIQLTEIARDEFARRAIALRWEPDQTDNAPQAVELFQKLQPDLAIIDIALKTANGIELTKNLKAIAPQIPVLIHDRPASVTSSKSNSRQTVILITIPSGSLYCIRRPRTDHQFLDDRAGGQCEREPHAFGYVGRLEYVLTGFARRWLRPLVHERRVYIPRKY